MKLFGFEIKRARKRAYEAADKGRRGKSMRLASSSGPNREISLALSDLRDRSRHFVRNNGWAKRAVEAVVKHTIGEGIRPAPLGSIEENKRIKAVWREWAETTACDFYGKTNFYGLQEMAMRAIVEGGDVLIVLHRTKPTAYGGIAGQARNDVAVELPIKLRLMEGDVIDHTRNGDNDKGIARLGVQFSHDGELLGYWLWNYHPGDGYSYKMNIQSEFYPKDDILHVYEVLRIAQARGVPFGVGAFMRLSDFSDYEDAQLMKQKVAACFAMFIENADGAPRNPEEPLIEKIEPGIIEWLASGETAVFSNPPSVGDYDMYSVRILQGIAAAYGITYEMLTMDYKRVNFTSGRMAKIDVTNNFKSWQYGMIVPQFLQPVWEWFMDACLLTGALNKRYSTDWTAPRVQQLDPVKETNSRLVAVQAGFETISEIIRENGREPHEFFEEYSQDMEMLQKLGINLSSINLLPDINDNNDEDDEQQEKINN